ncbi:uncharacterized protein LOC115875461 isoform X1 [Sitophilus oryzae]|uniref:Uncharacterized protein LOC115875461 isoform X1 n=1 Tax=Sitophilus oryzae TaxID=7048 RepID=A0A6J2X6G1_SITOR|nr:uncharacterized protein LOC115875461 isoform X1 [Sitophilus oryzae]
MNKEDLDIFRHLEKTPRNNTGLDLIKGLADRESGLKTNHKVKENVQVYAEEELVRKQEYVEMRCEMPGLPRSTFLMVFSPDGQRAASTHGNHNIYVTDLRSGKNIKTLVGHPRTPWCIAFHPTLDQIVASGCLGGQVRIWDLSGGSEVWTVSTQTVIASIAFHPNDRVLVIATFNEVYFWDWSRPEPYVLTATSNPKEKVRYVAFDKLGHKLITGIANSPHTRWERARAPVPVPRQERCASPYRRRITQRLVSSPGTVSSPQPSVNQESNVQEREPTSGVLERERRIALCYRNLVREYELLVHRYLQLYRPPTMIDRGTDPMEPNHYTSGTQTAENANSDISMPGPSGIRAYANNLASSNNSENNSVPNQTPSEPINTNPQPSTSHSQGLITPSRIFSVGRKPPSSIRGTQTLDSRKQKTDDESQPNNDEKRVKRKRSGSGSDDSSSSDESSAQNKQVPETATAENATDPEDRVLVVNLERLSPERLPSTSADSRDNEEFNISRYRASRYKRRLVTNLINSRKGLLPSPRFNDNSRPSDRDPRSTRDTSSNNSNVGEPNNRYSERFNEYIRATRERIAEFRRRNQTVLSTEGSSDATSQENAEGDGNISFPTLPLNTDRNVPPTTTTPSDTNGQQSNVEQLLSNIRRTAEEEVRNRILPIIRSIPPHDRPELIRLFESSRDHVRMRFRQMYPVFLRRHCRRTLRIDSSTDSSSSENEQDQSNSSPNRLPSRDLEMNILQEPTDSPAPTASPGPGSTERNFNTELEQLVTSLLTEIERNESEIGNDASLQTPLNISTGISNSASTSSARTRPSRNWFSNEPELGTTPPPPPPGDTLENIIYDAFFSERNRPDYPPAALQNVPPPMLASSDARNYFNTDTRTTTSMSYTSSSSSPGQRRRFFSHRVSAFMPTRVNYIRTRLRRNPHYTWGSGRAGMPRTHRNPPLALDDLINFAERGASSEERSSTDGFYPENIGINNMYTSMVQDMNSSLHDVCNINSNPPGDTSDILTSFSERLGSFINQSTTILRNIQSSMGLLSNSNETTRNQESEPRWTFNDSGFYVRDLRNEGNGNSETGTANESLQDLVGSLHTDHTYPRNPDSPPPNDNISSPLMTSLHLSLTHILREAHVLRRQVESIERIERATAEVAQLQLMRHLVIELFRHVRSLTGESRSAGVSSVRQMMAGTRISDSSPYESPNEEANQVVDNRPGRDLQPRPGTSSGTSSADQSTNSSGNPQQRRSTNRKTYPPSRFVRFARNCQRRPSIVHWFSRRYLRGIRPAQHIRPNTFSRAPCISIITRENRDSSEYQAQPLNYSTINSTSLSQMTERLERLLTDQMTIFTRSQETPSQSRSGPVDLGEHILALRLHGCWLRMNRILGGNSAFTGLRGLRSSYTTAVSQDGTARYNARHTLSLIVDGMSRHIEELDNSNVSNSMRRQINAVLAMSLLLTELLLLQVTDSIPPAVTMTLDPVRGSLARTLDELVSDMLGSDVSVGSTQLTRSLGTMRATMRNAHRTLEQTYNARRNAVMPTQGTDRRQLLGTINRCLRNINRTQERNSNSEQESNGEGSSSSRPANSGTSSTNENVTEAWYSTINDLITRYSDNAADEAQNQPSTSGERAENRETLSLSSTNDNSDDDPDDPEPEWYYHRNTDSSNNNSSLYRTNNVNLVQPSEPSYPPRLWSVPSVQVNDVPVSEPSFFAQRLLPHRQRVSELRSNPRVGIFRPRFLHPLYAHVNPFDADLDDPQRDRDQIYDGEMLATVTPNHRIQAWDISNWTVPSISNSLKNVVVNECKIHNDASVDIATDGTILVSLLPSGGYLNVTNRLGVYSLRWETLGQCLYTTSFEQNAVSVSLSPLSRHLLVGFASRRVSIIQSDRWVMARIYKIEQKDVPGDRLPVLRDLEQQRESRINCIRWLPTSGQGLIYATNTGQLVILS